MPVVKRPRVVGDVAVLTDDQSRRLSDGKTFQVERLRASVSVPDDLPLSASVGRGGYRQTQTPQQPALAVVRPTVSCDVEPPLQGQLKDNRESVWSFQTTQL